MVHGGGDLLVMVCVIVAVERHISGSGLVAVGGGAGELRNRDATFVFSADLEWWKRVIRAVREREWES